MGCDYYRYTSVLVRYDHAVSEDDMKKIKKTFPSAYIDMYAYPDGNLSITTEKYGVYCACRQDSLKDEREDCECVRHSKEVLTRENGYNKLFDSLTLEGNNIVEVKRFISTEKRL